MVARIHRLAMRRWALAHKERQIVRLDFALEHRDAALKWERLAQITRIA